MSYTTKKNDESILEWLEQNLDEERFAHSIGCAECSVQLAQRFGLDENKAYIAGLLHDCAKCFSKDSMLEIIKKHSENICESEMSNFKTLHAPVSAYVAKVEFGVEDEEILSAIRWHTLGKIEMSEFEKIIFLADKIEPNTRKPEYRNKLLKILDEKDGLNLAILSCYKETIKSLVERNLEICQVTIDIYNNLQKISDRDKFLLG